MRSLEDVQVAAAQRVVDGLGGEAAFDLAVLSGSLVAGLGHAHSDVDVHVVCKPGTEPPRRTYIEDGCEVQLTRTSPEQVERYVALTERMQATRTNREVTMLGQWELWHLVRLAQGRVILAAPRYRTLLERSRFDVARQVVMANFGHQSARAAEDADGLLADGDWPAACHSAVVALRTACETVLAACGDIYCIDRFTVGRLRRAPALRPVHARLWDLLYRLPPVDAGAEDGRRAVIDRLLAANGLVADALLHGWDAPLDRLRVPLAATGPSVVRAPAFGMSRFSDAIGLSGPGATVRTGSAVASVWAALDGSEPDTVAGRLRQQGMDDVDGEKVARVAASLVERGAAVTPYLRNEKEVAHGREVGAH